MKMPVPNWMKIDCPRCSAKAGKKCRFAAADFRIRHQERAELADKLFPPKKVPVVGSLFRDAARRSYQTRNWSAACRRGCEHLCTGFRKVKRAGLLPCENPYHRIAKESVDEPASME